MSTKSDEAIKDRVPSAPSPPDQHPGPKEVGTDSNREVMIDSSDLLKIYDVLNAAATHHEKRDESNAVLHMAQRTRYSPLTVELSATNERVRTLLAENNLVSE